MDPLNHLTRRQAVAGAGALAVASVVSPDALARGLTSARRAPSFRGGRFPDGIAAGDPTPNGITLWTRLDGVGGKGSVELEIARDSGFRRIVARTNIGTNADLGHVAKARIGRLRPHEQYYYRFSTRTADSPVGRFRTALPPDSKQPVKFAYFSCQEYTFGWFNAHALMAREDVDFVVNLGDFIYEIGFFPPIGVRSGNYTTGLDGPQNLEKYRERYRTVRKDPNLRRMASRHAMISLWDDHEVQNNYAGGDPTGGDINPPYSVARRNAAYRAWIENMPTYFERGGRYRLYHKASFGRLVDLFVLDERQYRAGQPCDDSGKVCADWDRERAFLGTQQAAFARGGLARSRAAWKLIANGVMIMPVKVSDTEYSTFDTWIGYPREREALLRSIESNRVKDVVFLTGDYHAFIAGNVQTAAGKTVATEFVGGSITSASDPEVSAILKKPGYGTPDHTTQPASELATQRAVNPWFRELDYLHHGYVVCHATAKELKVTLKKLETIRRQTTRLHSTRTFRVRRGRSGI
ncbi:MAG: alkaline phosphatase D family protein [Solirubrobacteraceae bacterium]